MHIGRISGKNRVIGGVAIAAMLGFYVVAAGGADQSTLTVPTPTPTATPNPTATPTPTPGCPLPPNYGIKKGVVSPEQPLQAVCRNGTILCLPKSAAQAHLLRGFDTPLGACSNPGNNGPCP